MATIYKKQVKSFSFLRTTSSLSWIQLGDYIFVESVGKSYKCVSLTSGGYTDDDFITIITSNGEVFQMDNGIIEDTGSVLNLSSVGGAFYNMSSASSSTSYTVVNQVSGGNATTLINTSTKPTITGSVEVAGATWVLNTDMKLVVSYDGNRLEHFFLSL